MKMEVGGKYNWKGQPERLVYLKQICDSAGYWHQFALVESPGKVWCEVRNKDLRMLEETTDERSKP